MAPYAWLHITNMRISNDNHNIYILYLICNVSFYYISRKTKFEYYINKTGLTFKYTVM